jgi:membrane-associated phospholipid phosphatase
MMRSRRAVGTVLVLALLCVTCADGPLDPSAALEAEAGSWKTWVIADGAALRSPGPPGPSSAQTAGEIDEIVHLQSALSPAVEATIRRWAGLPTTAWHDLALDLFGFYWALLPDVKSATPARSARGFALLHVAMYDALVATWDAKYVYRRPTPARADPRVRALVPLSDIPSYPSEHAAAAAAAAAVLSYLFPLEDTAGFHALAREAGEGRIAAGAAYRSDVEAGYALGRAVAAQVIERARNDGSDAPWTGVVPAGSAMWRPTPPRFVESPFDATAGRWRPWVIPVGDAYRPPPHPPLGSAEFSTALDELRRLSSSRTTAQADSARYWASESPSSRWEVFMQQEIDRRRLGPMRAARALALASVAQYDAMVACWDAKYFYWLLRPVSADPTIRTVFSTPPFPAYPSGHSTLSTAVAQVFAELFPDAAEYYRAKGLQASESRVLGGVHYRFDITAGERLGHEVGAAVVARARSDGARR